MERPPRLRRRPYKLLAEPERTAKDRPPTKPSAKDNSSVSDKQPSQGGVVAKSGTLLEPPREPSEKPPAQANDGRIVCKYCGWVNKDAIYCERCHRPLSDSLLKQWLLQRYFETCIMNADSMNCIVRTQEDVEFGDVKADYVVYHKDGTVTLLLVTTRFDEVLNNLIKYNAEKREKIEVVFLYVSTVSVPRLGEDLIRQASLYNIKVRFFSA